MVCFPQRLQCDSVNSQRTDHFEPEEQKKRREKKCLKTKELESVSSNRYNPDLPFFSKKKHCKASWPAIKLVSRRKKEANLRCRSYFKLEIKKLVCWGESFSVHHTKSVFESLTSTRYDYHMEVYHTAPKSQASLQTHSTSERLITPDKRFLLQLSK